MTQESFLYEKIGSGFGKDIVANTLVPAYITDNLHEGIKLRPYQEEAFKRFIAYEDYPEQQVPTHLAFNMATGSGKTLIMAGLILYLYEKGYRNFVFFTRFGHIVEKTRENFLNTNSNKHLFADKIVIDGKVVDINEVETFEGVSTDNINIKFVTMSKLHGDVHAEREDVVGLEDFKDTKTVLIADEAHNFQRQTRGTAKQQEEEKTWEKTIRDILQQNSENVLFEFTATLLDDGSAEVKQKYMDKIIYRYDIKNFVQDKYSKDIYTFASTTNENDRIIQALIVSQYRQEAASKYKINLKPVILFKAQKTVAQSLENHENFNKIIDNLSVGDINKVNAAHKDGVVHDAFAFFRQEGISTGKLVTKLKDGFAPEKCLNANNEAEVEQNQILLNSLESKDNQIRAIFAVQKLNEGWDVLNLFDIVRLYHSRDAKDNKPGKTTISEAQLIGRGARYSPFSYGDHDKFKRKFDEDAGHELAILERMYYHCFNEHRYVSEIHKALRERGWNIDQDYVDKELILKESFKQSDIYKNGVIYTNKREVQDKKEIKSFSDLSITKKDFAFTLLDGSGVGERVFDIVDSEVEDVSVLERSTGKTKTLAVASIDKHIVRSALAKNKYLTFARVYSMFGNVNSMTDFIEKEEYLGGLSVEIRNFSEDVFDNYAKLVLLTELFKQIESELKNNSITYRGSKEFTPRLIKEVFGDVKLHLHKDKNGPRLANGIEEYVKDKKWYAFNALYGTSEEKALVEFIGKEMGSISAKYEDVYLLRNEQHFKLHNFSDGLGFAPDFVLFAKQKSGKNIIYQIFIEPKGAHLMEADKWKEDFLKEIKEKYGNKVVEFSKSKKYTITGVPFYNTGKENNFRENMSDVLGCKK